MSIGSRSVLLSSVCGIALTVSGASHAQSLDGGTYDWSGSYVGLGLDIANTGIAWSTDYGGMYGGEVNFAPVLTFGHNWQNGNVVLGLEGSLTGPGQNGQAEFEDPGDYMGLYDWKWSAGIRGRAGIATGRLLTFATAGVTIGDLELDGCEGTPCFDESYSIHASDTVVGMNVGFGAEYAISNRSTIKGEYIYTGFPALYAERNQSGEFTEPGDLSTDAHTLRLSWNYQFGDRDFSQPAGLTSSDHDWSGFYVGAHALGGLIVDDVQSNYYESNRALSSAGAVGLSFGHNWQFGDVVLGAVADISTGGLDSYSYWGDDYVKEQDWNWLATIRGRAGITTGDLLLYTTAGLAVSDMRLWFCEDLDDRACDVDSKEAIYDGTNLGLAAGVGAEYAISEKMTLFGEYNFVGFPARLGDRDEDGSLGDTAEHTTAAHFIKLGLNYSLDGGKQLSADPLHDWSGLYAGAVVEPQLRYVSAGVDDGGGAGSNFKTPAGVVLGRNWQSGNFVWGVEGDFNAGSSSTEFSYYDGDYIIHSEWNWSASLRARAGIASGKAFLYATGGLAVADIEAWSCDGTDCASATDDDVDRAMADTLYGLSAGVGVEYALSENLSAVGEYRYTGFPSEMGAGSSDFSDFTNYAHGVRLGINYSF